MENYVIEIIIAIISMIGTASGAYFANKKSTALVAYRLEQLEKKQDNSVVDTDFITFASASGVNTFFDGGATISDRTSVVCIGEITAEALESHGVNSFKIAKTKDTDGILETIIKEVTLKEG